MFLHSCCPFIMISFITNPQQTISYFQSSDFYYIVSISMFSVRNARTFTKETTAFPVRRCCSSSCFSSRNFVGTSCCIFKLVRGFTFPIVGLPLTITMNFYRFATFQPGFCKIFVQNMVVYCNTVVYDGLYSPSLTVCSLSDIVSGRLHFTQ